MGNPKTFLLLIFVPYLFLVVIFHLQLQMPTEDARLRAGEVDDRTRAGLIPVRAAVAGSEFDKESFHFRDLMIKDSNGDAYGPRTDNDRSRDIRRRDGADTYRPAQADPIPEQSNRLKLIKVSRTFQNGTRRVQEMIRLLDKDLRRLELDGASEIIDVDSHVDLFGGNLGTDHANNIRSPLTEQCLRQLTQTGHLRNDVNVFRFVGGIYVMSAYLDGRLSAQPPFVRMIGLMSRGRKPDLYCHFPYDSANGTVTSYGSEVALFYEMCENHNKEHGGWIISCKVPSFFTDRDQLPCSVFVSERPNRDGRSSGEVELPIYTTAPENETGFGASLEGDFGVCVPPLFGHIPSTTLVEFVELSQLLGARHLVFYVHQVTIAIKKVLEYYQERGAITVINWDLPVRDKDIWYHGQLLAINDCLYRTMHRFSHVVFNDVDEFLVPHQHDTWHGMIRHLESSENRTRNRTQYSGFSFQSAFFDPLVNGNGKILYDLESDLRTKIFSRVRTKVMVRPLRIFELGIHHISRPLRERYAKRSVEPSVAFIHHYRKCMMDFDPRMKCQVYARDETVSRYIPSLRHNVHQTLWILKELDKMSRRP